MKLQTYSTPIYYKSLYLKIPSEFSFIYITKKFYLVRDVDKSPSRGNFNYIAVIFYIASYTGQFSKISFRF